VPIVLPQRLCDTVKRMRGAHGVNECVDMPAGVVPDLLAEWHVAGNGIVIIELVAPPVAGTTADLASRPDHLLDQGLGNFLLVALDVRHARAERLHRHTFLIAE